jgi:D-3-phosphoglycerate dehydrogenase
MFTKSLLSLFVYSYHIMFARSLLSSSSTRFVATHGRRCTAAYSTTSPNRLADVEVEHGRGQWKTYGDVENYKPGRYQIKTFNKISPIGLARFPSDSYDVREGDSAANAHAILIRSHKLEEEDIPHTVRAIARYVRSGFRLPLVSFVCMSSSRRLGACTTVFLLETQLTPYVSTLILASSPTPSPLNTRLHSCGAGTNNIPVSRMTELGIPVFNTPGANANAVMELVLCGLFLGSRRIVDGINHMKSLGEQGVARERVEKDKAMFGGREIKGKTLAVIGLGAIGSLTARTAHEFGMRIKGYDPGLSVQSALRLPRNLALEDSIASAVADADYISINIPYIKGEGGTHGIIGSEVMAHFKSDAVLLNFARGELVDSGAMKAFLDKGDGRYVSDFPDDLLWDHPNAIILPHLGASTGEAEDGAASMAADTIRDFLETGTIKNSVNFPSTFLPECPGGNVRFTVVNKNKPGVLAKLTEAFASENLNIVQQINQSRGDVAYNVLDIDTSSNEDVLSFKTVQEKITMLEGVLSSRVIYGLPGTGYAKNIQGEYFV